MTSKNANIALVKNCPATEIPSGQPVLLTKGTRVKITQALGGSITLLVEGGSLVRVEPEYTDALGKKFASTAHKHGAKNRPIEEQVLDVLKTCFDPEIPVNIVDLGLVYRYEIRKKKNGRSVDVTFTLTAPGCGMGDILKKEIERKLKKIPSIIESKANVVFEPMWDQSRMSEAAKLQLGML